jgi:hypothetical protein
LVAIGGIADIGPDWQQLARSLMMGWTPRRRHRCAKVEVLNTT